MSIRNVVGEYITSKFNAELANEICNWLKEEGYENHGRKEWYAEDGEYTSREEFTKNGYIIHLGWHNFNNGMSKNPVIEIFDSIGNYYSIDDVFGYN